MGRGAWVLGSPPAIAAQRMFDHEALVLRGERQSLRLWADQPDMGLPDDEMRGSLPLGRSQVVDDGYLLEAFLRTTPDHVYFKDAESRFTRISLALARWMGLESADEAIGRCDSDFFAEEHASKALADERRIIATGEPSIGLEEREVWPDGTVTWVSTTKVPLFGPDGEVIGIFGMSRDITERRLAAELLSDQSAQLALQSRQLAELSLTDDLTGLHNRRGLQAFGGSLVDVARRENSPLCLLFVDLDDLKAINDTRGHAAGDLALVRAARVLRESVRGVDVVARVGGDEFAVVLAGASRAETELCVARLRTLGARPADNGLDTGLSMSIGIATLGDDGALTLDDLIEHADRAMYEEKHSRAA
jgi:diguanylate cyclase (GGDEF)-like protein/PAS domain S-box-containing protein